MVTYIKCKKVTKVDVKDVSRSLETSETELFARIFTTLSI